MDKTYIRAVQLALATAIIIVGVISYMVMS